MGNEPESAAGGPLPTGVKWANIAPVVPIAAAVIAMACELGMWQILGDTVWNPETGATFPLPGWFTTRWELLSVAPAGAGVLVAVAGLALRGRARWLLYLQIGLWLLTLASSVAITEALAPLTGVGPLYGLIIVGGVAGVVAVALLTRSLRRPAGASRAGTWRSPRWRWPCPVSRLLAARYAYGPGHGTATGIVTRCSAAEDRAGGWPRIPPGSRSCPRRIRPG